MTLDLTRPSKVKDKTGYASFSRERKGVWRYFKFLRRGDLSTAILEFVDSGFSLVIQVPPEMHCCLDILRVQNSKS